jgi:DNA-binding response OmpR family regulator
MAEILIIDDDPQIRRLLTRILTGAGHSVHEAADGWMGTETFSRVHPALVITDIVMQEKEGIETIRDLRGQDPGVPILAISGGAGERYLDLAIKLGATASLAKPFGVDELLSVVAELLARRGGSQTE